MINKRCLITGANGFLGSKLSQSLKNTHLSARCAVRKLEGNVTSSKGDLIEIGLIDSSTNWKEALVDIDIVVHTAARVHVMAEDSSDALEKFREINTLGTINLAKQAIDSGVKRFIFISTIKVNGESTSLGAPYTSKFASAAEDSYSKSKSEAEEQLLILAKDTGLEVVIIRPTLIYGPGVKANFAFLMNLVSKGLPLPFGCITDNRRSLVSVNNLVDLIITCTAHPKAVNQIFLVSDDYDVSTSEIIRQLARSLGKPQWQLPVPKWCYKLVGKIFGKQDVVNRLLGSLQVDITSTKEILGWKPPQSFENGFDETAQAFLKSQKSNKK